MACVEIDTAASGQQAGKAYILLDASNVPLPECPYDEATITSMASSGIQLFETPTEYEKIALGMDIHIYILVGVMCLMFALGFITGQQR